MRFINKEKLEKIKFNNSNFFVAIDFDRTITANNSEDSWDACGNILGKGYKNESNELYKKYGPIESDYLISFEQKNKAMVEWYYESLKLYYKYNLTLDKLEESLNNSNLIFRSGAKEFLQEMYIKNIPVIILSAGIGNVIEGFFKKNDCYYDNIYIISNFLEFDEFGNILEYKGKLIHTLNKTMKGHLNFEFNKKIEGKKFRLLIGDFIEDKKMLPSEEWDRSILVGFLTKEIRQNMKVYRDNFDVVLTGKDASFESISEIVFKPRIV